ncbi:MAG TPA: AMP-binding protein, partial [Thermoanaerobaculia bacterium]|nr:AMP-binding protein [Thermoanaerobaculia bacterium]
MDTLASRLRAGLQGAEDTPALGAVGDDAAVRWLSRVALRRRLAARCAWLRHQGLGRGDVCLLALPSTLDCAELTLAAYLLGAVPLLVAPPLIQGTHSGLRQVLLGAARRARPRLALCDPSLAVDAGALRRAGRGTRVVLEVPAGEEGEAKLPDAPQAAPEEIAGMQLTSGTTRAPRICVWSHRGVLAALDGMAAAMALGEGDVCVNWTPLYHDMGLVNNLLLCVARGVPLAMMTPQQFVKRPALWPRALAAAGATVSWSPNFGFALAARATERELAGVRLDRVRALYNAAERIHP